MGPAAVTGEVLTVAGAALCVVAAVEGLEAPLGGMVLVELVNIGADIRFSYYAKFHLTRGAREDALGELISKRAS